MGAVGARVKGAFGYARCVRSPGGHSVLGGAGRGVWERGGACEARSAPFFRWSRNVVKAGIAQGIQLVVGIKRCGPDSTGGGAKR